MTAEIISLKEFRAKKEAKEKEGLEDILANKEQDRPLVHPDAYNDALDQVRTLGDDMMYKLVKVFVSLASLDKTQQASVTFDVYQILLKEGLPRNSITDLGFDNYGIQRIGVNKTDLEVLLNKMEKRLIQ